MDYVTSQSFVTDFYAKRRADIASSTGLKSGELLARICDLPKRVVVALAHAIKHLSDFNVADPLLETNYFSKFSEGKHMILAANTLTNLEIFENSSDHTVTGSLLWILDHTTTKFGARLLKRWIGRPLASKA
jgi:DNA mismatch repair protein MSH3